MALEREERPLLRPAEEEAAIEEAVRLLRGDGIVVLPTDTVYGVGCDPWSAAAIRRLYEAKDRPQRLAIPILLSDMAAASQVSCDLPASFEALASAYWPGGLTIVVPAHPDLPPALTSGLPTVALRMPDHPVALRLIRALGGALAVTSANLSGHPAPDTAQGALAQLDGRVDLILDGGVCPGGVASTIVDVVESPPRLLRRGAITAEALRRVLPDLVTMEPR